MDNLIILRCPQTGMDVQTLLYKQEHEDARPYYVAVTCPGLHAASFHRQINRQSLGSGQVRPASVGTLWAGFPGYEAVRYHLLPRLAIAGLK
jgi:hypothetical protein